jgi:hypothetical protein
LKRKLGEPQEPVRELLKNINNTWHLPGIEPSFFVAQHVLSRSTAIPNNSWKWYICVWLTCIIINHYSKTSVTHFSFNLLRIEASTRFEHYLLILRMCYTTSTCILHACYVSWLHQGF